MVVILQLKSGGAVFFKVSVIFRFFIIVLLLTSFYLAGKLPIQAGWENNSIESLQMLVLSGGLISALYFAFKSSDRQRKWFAWMLVPIWIILMAREVSWGTSLLLPPLYTHPETGPVYSSKQLEYRTLMHIVAALLLVASGLIFFLSKQYKTILRLFQKRAFPWFEVSLAFIAVILSTTAEGHGFYQISFLNEAQLQVLEELFELCVYLTLVSAQIYVLSKLKFK